MTNPAVIPTPQDKEWYPLERWTLRHQDHLTAKNDFLNAQVVFIGDSITEGWGGSGKPIWQKYFEKYNAFNVGISGDETQHVLWRFENGVLDGLAPKAAVLLIGTNNIGNDPKHTPEEAADGILEVIEQIMKKLPTAKLLVIEPLPRGKTSDEPLRKAVIRINDLIRPRLAALPVTVLDLQSEFLLEDGTLPAEVAPDSLHPGEEGYRRMAEAIDAILKTWIG